MLQRAELPRRCRRRRPRHNGSRSQHFHRHPHNELLPYFGSRQATWGSMIEVRNIYKSFGTQTVLKGISFKVSLGESLVIIGRSGCGKSVLLKLLIGLIKPEAGEIWIDGENITSMNERELMRIRKRFGMVFQGAALFDSMTVAENVAFPLRRNTSLSENEIHKKVMEVLDLVGLKGSENKKTRRTFRRHAETCWDR